jgi:hypothetical protein
VSVLGVLAEAWRLYRALFWRSLLITAAVFLVLDGVGAAAESAADAQWTLTLAGIFISVLTGFGDLVVEGALAEDQRDIDEGREPPPLGRLARRMAPRIGLLLVASLVYAAVTNLGLLLLVVPGLIVATRWSLIVPVIVLEDRGIRDGFRRSSRLVKGQSFRVFAVVAIVFVGSGLIEALLHELFFWLPEYYANLVGGYLASLLAAPYVAHALAVMYYRLVELEPGYRSGSSSAG